MGTGLGGCRGGYVLCHAPDEYSVGEILECMKGTLATVSCLAKDAEPYVRTSICKTLPMWTEFKKWCMTISTEKRWRTLNLVCPITAPN